jgi:hypothetical protein
MKGKPVSIDLIAIKVCGKPKVVRILRQCAPLWLIAISRTINILALKHFCMLESGLSRGILLMLYH